MKKPKIGFLPLYVLLYDQTSPEVRPDIDAFCELAAKNLRKQGLEVVDAPVCRLADEFEEAVDTFQKEDVDAVVTLHLAYSPSLESEGALKKLQVPIIVMDTTPDYVYDQSTEMGAMMLNHGIHGVQDMCNLLRRNGKKFRVYAGHMEHSKVLERVADAARVAMMAHALKTARVGLVGEPFRGMGDFLVPFDVLRQDLGVLTVPYDFEEGKRRIAAVTEQELWQEFEEDKKQFVMDSCLTREVYDRSARVCLAIRKWVQEEKLSAFTINFMETEGSNPGLPVMPFIECCKAMSRGQGYAGEGDVLTAALTGALLAGYEEVTFAEMFCPNWKGNSVFLSHMGEFNYKVADGIPVMEEKPFPFTSAGNPTAAYKSMKPGRAVLVNLAPVEEHQYAMSIMPGQMLKVEGSNTMEHAVNGWFQPDMPLAEMLERLSQAGGTHHSVLVYGADPAELALLADFLGFEKCILRKERNSVMPNGCTGAWRCLPW